MIFCLCFCKTAGTAKISPPLNRYFWLYKQFLVQDSEDIFAHVRTFGKYLCPGYKKSLPRLWTTETWSFLPSAPATTSRRCTLRWVVFSTPHHIHLLHVLVDRFHDLHVDHPQTYRCIAENELGKIQSRDVHVRAGRVNFSSFAMHTVDEDKTSRCDKIEHDRTWLDKLDFGERENCWQTKWDGTQPDQKMVGLNSKLSRKDMPRQDQNLTPLLTKH